MSNRLALDMGLNVDSTPHIGSISMTLREKELRRQIYWSLYCHDKLSASYTGRVCTMLVTLPRSNSNTLSDLTDSRVRRP